MLDLEPSAATWWARVKFVETSNAFYQTNLIAVKESSPLGLGTESRFVSFISERPATARVGRNRSQAFPNDKGRNVKSEMEDDRWLGGGVEPPISLMRGLLSRTRSDTPAIDFAADFA
jgi:hypothetical protein